MKKSRLLSAIAVSVIGVGATVVAGSSSANAYGPGDPSFNAAPYAVFVSHSTTFQFISPGTAPVTPVSHWEVIDTGTFFPSYREGVTDNYVPAQAAKDIAPVTIQTASGAQVTYPLRDGFVLNVTTGVVSATGSKVTYGTLYPELYTVTAYDSDNQSIVSGNLPIGPEFSDVQEFSGVSSNAFATEIYTLSMNGIIGGYSDGTFRPTVITTREAYAHYAITLLKKAGASVASGPCSSAHPSVFKDVANSSPFCADIDEAAGLGIVGGYAGDIFKPTAAVSRQAAAAFTYRLQKILGGGSASSPAPACTSAPFTDVPVSSPFCGDIAALVKSNVIQGYSDGSFHPTTGVQRQAAAAYLYRIAASHSYLTKYGTS